MFYDTEPAKSSGAAPKFVRLLKSVAEAGSFAIQGSMVHLPVVNLPGFGRLTLPPDQNSLARLDAFCQQAPFGRGTETIVDTSVRNVLQADAKEVTISNPRFETELQTVFAQVDLLPFIP
jgi:hypothetical protein